MSSIASSLYSGTAFDAKGHAIAGTGFKSLSSVSGDVGMIAFGTVMGGAGAALTGGNFWQGAVTGLVVSSLNHSLHKEDPPGKDYKKFFRSLMKQAQRVGNDIKDWASNVNTASAMTADWALGMDYKDTYFIGGKVADAMKTSAGITKARNDYYATGKAEGNYNFGLSGLKNSGLNPIQQFVGSYHYKIIPMGDQLFYSLTNNTSFASAAYHIWPYSWNWQNGPMSNKYQTYIFTEPIRR